jgi:hypothetical protein
MSDSETHRVSSGELTTLGQQQLQLFDDQRNSVMDIGLTTQAVSERFESPPIVTVVQHTSSLW